MATLPGHAVSDAMLVGTGLEEKNFGSGTFIPQLGQAAPDNDPPAILNVTPEPETQPGEPGGFPASYTLAHATPIEFDITDEEPGLALVVVSCTISTIPGTFTVYRDGEFTEGFESSTVTPIADGFHFAIVRDAGWPAGAEVWIDVDASDAAGNVTPSEGEAEITLTSIDVTPAMSTFTPSSPSDTRQMTATGHYSNGSTADLTATVTWASDTPAVATISSGGAVTGVTAGSTEITATLGAIVGSTDLTIAITLSSITVTPANSTWAPTAGSDRQQMTATGNYSNGTTGNITTSVTWVSSATGVVTISNAGGTQGQAAPVANGVSTITATLGAVSGNTQLTLAMLPSSITVAPAAPTWIPVLSSDRQAFTATANYPSGATADVTATATWTSGTTTVATVESPGTIAAVLVGTSIITATVGAVSGNQTLTIDIPVDDTSGKGVPVNAFQWSLVGLTINHLYLCQEASPNNLADSGPGGIALTANGNPLYQQTVAGWTRLAVGFNQTAAQRFAMNSGVGPNCATTASFWLIYAQLPTAGSGTRGVLNAGSNVGIGLVNTNPWNLRYLVGAGQVDDSTTGPVQDDLVHPISQLHDPTTATGATRDVMYTDEAKTIATPAAGTEGTKGIGGGAFSTSPPDARVLLAVLATGTNVPPSDAAVKLIFNRLKWNVTAWS